jgi:hypothetical protein
VLDTQLNPNILVLIKLLAGGRCFAPNLIFHLNLLTFISIRSEYATEKRTEEAPLACERSAAEGFIDVSFLRCC